MTSLLDILGLLETDSNKSLVESIRKGYLLIFENTSKSLVLYRGQSKSMTEAIDYRRSDEAEAFLNKYGISEDDLNYLGSGDFGSAYSIGNDKVLKITSSKSEANLAHQIMNGKFSSFVRIYAVEPIDNSYFILQEELEEDSDIENMWYEVEEALQSQGLPVQYIANFDEDEYIEKGGEISDDAREFMNDLWGISSDYRRLGIEASDIRPENLGRASDGTIKAFDIDDRKR